MSTPEPLRPRGMTVEDKDETRTARMLPLFGTPLVNTRLEDMEEVNASLLELVATLAVNVQGIARSNVGGWHSELNFLDSGYPPVAALRASIDKEVRALVRAVAREPSEPENYAYRIEGWANLLRQGQYNAPHSHPNALWSGVYYVNGNPPASNEHAFSGKLELMDPRPAASLTFAAHTNLYGRCLVNPHPGQLVLFPGWVQHMVHPFFGQGERVSIAFNVIY